MVVMVVEEKKVVVVVAVATALALALGFSAVLVFSVDLVNR